MPLQGGLSIERMCQLAQVSRAGFYRHLQDRAPEEAVDLEQSASLLARCLAQLGAVQRRCVQLAFWDGYSHAQVALATGNPIGSVKSWIRRGLLSLRQCLQP